MPAILSPLATAGFAHILHEADVTLAALQALRPASVVVVEGNAPLDVVTAEACRVLGIPCFCVQQGWSPYVHTGDLGTLDAAIAEEMMRVTQRCVDALQRAYRPDGFNVGMNLGQAAGAGVPDHLHIHVVPRWSGDTNFMPVFGETKVLPETLEQTYDRLQPLFAPA